MKREELREIITPLNTRERYYRDHPEDSAIGFQNMEKQYDEKYGYYYIAQEKELPIYHGISDSDKHRRSMTYNYYFNKQTRYSNVLPHRHSFVEMFYIYSGSCTGTINGKKVTFSKGDICIMDQNTIHQIGMVQEKDIVLNCLFYPDYFNSNFTQRLINAGPVAGFISNVLNEHAFHDSYLIFKTDDERIRELFEDIFCEFMDPGICSNDIIDSYLSLLFIQLGRQYQAKHEEEYRNQSKKYITEILKYIEDFADCCTLEEVAERFDYNSAHLSRILKKTTGKSFKEIVDRCRMNRAEFLLRTTDRSISSIALECGWTNQNQFYKKFNEVHDMSPKEFKKRRKTTGGNES